VEPHISLSGVQATRRLSIRPQAELVLLVYLIQTVLEHNERRNNPGITIVRSLPYYPVDEVSRQTGIAETDLKDLASSFGNAKKPLLITGGVSTAHLRGLEVAVLTSLLQWIMGMTEDLIDFSQAESFETVGTRKDVELLIGRLNNDHIGVLFISRTDPVSMLPEAVRFSDKMNLAQLTVGLSDHMNDTIKGCDVVLPLSHSLESWGDNVPYRGLRNIIQPAIEPQYDTFSEGDILLQMLNDASTYKDFLFNKWNQKYGEDATGDMLERGYRTESVTKVRVDFNTLSVSSFIRRLEKPSFNYGVVLCLSHSIRSFDGRSRDLPLLQEIPDPLTTISYGSWISVSPLTAEYFNLKDRDEVELTAEGLSLKLPVKIQKHLSDNVVMVQRDLIPLPMTAVDFRTGEASWFVPNISLDKTGAVLPLPIMSGSMQAGHRGILPSDEEHEHGHGAGEHPRWYPEHEHKDYRWGMAIDLESCIGCNACTAACYVENNIPLVGLKEHLNGREMSWIRIQPYYDDQDNFEFVPMMCQQCDNAPCEPVCPVYASYHNPEGLNVQVYNRCVGTRYCSNNCPYKVRRFNWFDHRLVEPLDKMYNPDISVRGRGIMEKCTFCIQRIRAAKDHAKDENRLVQDGEIVPACAQTCPTEAITFGNLKDPESEVSRLARSERSYHVLEELGTEPAVNYLRKRGNKHEA
jgi:Fe-S-cluster-containing dehydrogenase component